MPESPSPTYRRIYAIVRAVPDGRVATYGQIAREANLPGRARQVGYALHALDSDSDVPWHRIVNRKGRISLPPERGGREQRRRLEQEGIRFSADDRIDLEAHGWKGRDLPDWYDPEEDWI